MRKITYTLSLLSDAEIGSGLGGETLNDIVARDHSGQPVLRATHIKGLLRATLGQIASDRVWDSTLEELVFGAGGADGSDGTSAAIRVRDATALGVASVRRITRTALTELGVADGATLRTTEAVTAGTEFQGEIRVASDAGPVVDLAVRLSLLALGAVGGGRNRGSGTCLVRIDGESRRPGVLLGLLDAALSADTSPSTNCPAPQAAGRESPGKARLLHLEFVARDPVCCPETPIVESNVLRAGFGIPASAVLGVAISRLAERDPALARATLEDPRTRAWPLLPCAPLGSPAPHPVPVRVSLSHRMSKLPAEGIHEFRDAAVEAYDWRRPLGGAPLKGADGVLLRSEDGSVALWRSGDMPRIVTAHAVHYDPSGEGKRNLFTVEALAPAVFSGWLSLPPAASAILEELLADEPEVSFGKARSVRGAGSLAARPAGFEELTIGEGCVFVLQSPAAIPDAWSVERTEDVFRQLVKASGWGMADAPIPEKGRVRITTQAACAVRFGWNRKGLGSGVGQTHRLRARRVLLPGSVFVIERPASNLPELLLRGLGIEDCGEVDGRQQGYGSVLPHPGVAKTPYAGVSALRGLASSSAGRLAHQWFTKGTGCSASQIARLAALIRPDDGSKAADYLERQHSGRSARFWDRWSPVFEDVRAALQANPATAEQALRTWQDLVVANRQTDLEG